MVIDKTLAHHPAHPLHEAGSTRRSPMSGLAKLASRKLSTMAMTA